MKIEVNLTAEVFRRFTLFDVLRRRKMWRSPATFALILGASATVCYVMHHVEGAVMLGTVLLIVGLGMPLVYFLNFFSSVRQQIVKLGLSRPQYVYTITLTEAKNGIEALNGKEAAKYEWKKIHHIYRDLTADYMFITPERGFILPHTCMEEGTEAAWELYKKKLPEGKYTIIK